MDEQKKCEVARQYVDKQLAVMREYGAAPRDLSEAEYNGLVEQIAALIRT